jgi:hypothetical protein
MIVSGGPPPGPSFNTFFQSIPFNAVLRFYVVLVFTNPSPFAVFIVMIASCALAAESNPSLMSLLPIPIERS